MDAKQVKSRQRVINHGEVYTSRRVVEAMLDMVKPETERIDSRFLEPACGHGNFLTAILERKLDVVEKKYGRRRVEFERYCTSAAGSVYGIDLLEDNVIEARERLLGILTGRYSRLFNAAVKCKFIESVKFVLERNIIAGDALELTRNPAVFSEWSPITGETLKFDVIIGNPPYQLNDGGGTGSSARPIYHKFIEQAKKMNPRFMAMIIPARWYSGGKGLDEFRCSMLNDSRIRRLVDFIDSRDCFTGVDIAGGVCYFLWNRDYPGKCIVVSVRKIGKDISERALNEFETFIRDNRALEIVKRVTSQSKSFMNSAVSSRMPFGITSNEPLRKTGDFKLISSAGIGKISKNKVSAGSDLIPKWKVMLSKTSHDHAGQPDKQGMRRVFSRIEVVGPNVVCTESYLVVGGYDTEIEAQNMCNFLKTQFCRFLVSIQVLTQNITKRKFSFVPSLDMKISWSDKKLYDMFNLSGDDIAYIDSIIRPIV